MNKANSIVSSEVMECLFLFLLSYYTIRKIKIFDPKVSYLETVSYQRWGLPFNIQNKQHISQIIMIL